MILSLWSARHPQEVADFARRTAAYRKAIASAGVGTIARRTQWCPELKVPTRLDRAISVQFGTRDAPLDWMRDPQVLEIVIDELTLVKLVRNPTIKHR